MSPPGLHATSFEDHFSKRAREYALYRPRYPVELFAYLAAISPGRRMAWDCGTGNGQAAAELISHFDQVVATDASPDQLAQAAPHERIIYRLERAEDASLDTGTVDLVTVALAVHWFDLDQFYRQVRRVVRKGGILAVWTYHLPVMEPRIVQVLTRYYAEILAGYWPDRFLYVAERYRTLPFPFEELAPPEFEMEAEWDLGQMLGYLDTWSATRRFQEERDVHPVKMVWPALVEAWGDPERKRAIRWPMYIRVGRVSEKTIDDTEYDQMRNDMERRLEEHLEKSKH